MTCRVTLFDCRPQVFKNSLKLTIFGILNELLSTRSMNVAHFARNCNVETFSVIFKHCVDKRPQFSILVNKNYRAIYDHYWLFFNQAWKRSILQMSRRVGDLIFLQL